VTILNSNIDKHQVFSTSANAYLMIIKAVNKSKRQSNSLTMKKILCPTDFSDSAMNAIAYAAKLAKAAGCTLTLLHVKSVFDFSFAELSREKHDSTLPLPDELEALSIEVSKTFKVSCYAEVVSEFETLSSVINERAEGFDLIVIGSNGADDLYQFFNGSNTYNAIMKSNIPVLLIPAGFTYCEIRTMVYAYDYLRERKLPLAHLALFLKPLNCQLTVLQVMEEAFSRNADKDLKELQFIFKTCEGEGIDFQYDTVTSSDVPQGINTYMLHSPPDALALCSIHRNLIGNLFHKSIIKSITAIANYPVYVFHE
jgi:nucleotide-binding universal stress UspA family protein